MARYVYNRCSTDSQDYAQQQNCITIYLNQHGINPETDITKTVVEKVSGTIKHTERKLAVLLAKCKEGDTIYISELSRLGRNMSDLFAIVTEACERGIKIVQCKDGSTIENESIQGKALLFALSLASEIEVSNTRQRTQMALDARKKLLETDGYFISKSGRECTKLGRPKRDPERPNDFDLSGIEAAAMARQEAKIRWAEQSKGYNWVRAQLAKGKSRALILEEFNELHAADPENYSTREGKPLSKGVLSKWCREMNPLAG